MTTVVILQPHFFPWYGLFEQIRLSDLFIYFNDVPFPQGRGFLNRVQIKTPSGPTWLTVPVVRKGHPLIKDLRVDPDPAWRDKHLSTLSHNLAKTPFADDALGLAEAVYRAGDETLDALNRRAMTAVCSYLNLPPPTMTSEGRGQGAKADRLLSILAEVGADVYLTGHGGKNYLPHETFERHGIAVRYMDYAIKPYPQKYGEFTPYVSILDLIANTGPDAPRHFASTTKDWREVVHG